MLINNEVAGDGTLRHHWKEKKSLEGDRPKGPFPRFAGDGFAPVSEVWTSVSSSSSDSPCSMVWGFGWEVGVWECMPTGRAKNSTKGRQGLLNGRR